MKRSLIASFAALSIVATPALAATTAAKPTKASMTQHKKGKGAHAKLTNASVETAKNKKSH